MSVLIHTEGSVARNPSFRLQNALMQYPRQTNTSLYGHAKTGRNISPPGFLQPPGANAGGMGFPASRRDPR